jgi:O-antigen/teichoic acid export membrane protein
LIYLFSPWEIGLAFEKDSLNHLLKFGLPYQANTFLAVIKDRLMNVFLWKIIGATGVGILGWAQKWAQMPLRFVMDSVMKVTFPAYARMQSHQEELTKAIEKTLFFISFLIFPLILGMAVLARPLMAIIPRYSKWEVALLAFYFYCFNSLWGAVTTPLTNVLAAIGKIKIVFRLMVMWTILTWVFYPLLAFKFGYDGAAAAAALVALSSVVAIWVAKKEIKFQFLSSIAKPLVASMLMGVVVFSLARFLARNILGISVLAVVGGLVYFALIYFMLGEQLLADVRQFLNAVKKKS